MVQFGEFVTLKATDLWLADGTRIGAIMYRRVGDTDEGVYVTAIVDHGNDHWEPGTAAHQRLVRENVLAIFEDVPEAA